MGRSTSAVLALSLVIVASAAIASDGIFRLSGWAEIPSTYRHPGPVSGQFAGPANGVIPPYAGQPIPGFSGMIPAPIRGSYFALPDNGFGAQTNSADFVIGFYRVSPRFKTMADGTTSRGPVTVHGFTPFSDPKGLLDASYITNGPVYNRLHYYPPPAAQILVDPSIRSRRLPLQSVESVTPVDDFTLLVGLDNNYPGGNGRVPGTPDGTEIITMRSAVPLWALRVQSCKGVKPDARGARDHGDRDWDRDCR